MIELVPMGNVDTDLMRDICRGIKNVFRHCGLSDETLDIPQEAYNPSRGQFDSLPLLNALMQYARPKKVEKILGITSVDIYTENLNFIFGHAYVGGNTCMISIHRLNPEYYGQPRDYRVFLDRCVKEAIHELGHSFGLGHCNDRRCVMVFSNNISEVDAKSEAFCQRCGEMLGRMFR